MDEDRPKVAANRLLRAIQGTEEGERRASGSDQQEGTAEGTPERAPKAERERPSSGVGEHLATSPRLSESTARRGRVCLGVDIGTRTVKAALVRRRPARSEVFAWATRNLPDGAEADQVGQAVRELVTSLGGRKASKVYAVLSGPEVLLRRMPLPKMPDKELKEAVRWESKKYLPFPVEEAVLDYQVVGEVQERGQAKLDVLMVAAREEFVESQLALFQRAGLVLHGLLAAPFALGNVVRLVTEDGEGLAAVDLGCRSSRIAFFDPGGRVTLSRDIAVGGDDLTEALSGAFPDAKQSEAFKRRHGIPALDEQEGTQKAASLSQASLMMRPVLERLLGEIQRSIHYYRTRFGGGLVSRVLLSGGGAQLVGLDQYLAAGLKLDVSIMDPISVAAAEGARPQDPDPGVSIAVGLALSSGKEPNLLPDRAKRRYRQAADRMAMRLSALAAALVLIALSVLGVIEKQQLDATLGNLEAQWLALQPLMAREKSARKEIQEIGEALGSIEGDGETMLPILRRLSQVVPAYVVLSELSLEGATGPGGTPRRLELGGRVQGNRLLLESYLVKFRMDLERAHFASPAVTSKRVVESGGGLELEFRLSCGLERPVSGGLNRAAEE